MVVDRFRISEGEGKVPDIDINAVRHFLSRRKQSFDQVKSRDFFRNASDQFPI